MPPLRSDRASRACERCRRLKTRCYPSKQGTGGCLRCETQDQDCSLKDSRRSAQLPSPTANTKSSNDTPTTAPVLGVEDRLARLETVVHTLVGRLDTLMRQAPASSASRETSLEELPPASADGHDAPVLLIRGIAEDVCASIRDDSDAPDSELDPISGGVIKIEDAYELLSLFRLHYGRWVNFDQQISLEQLMTRVRASPLLFYSICLVAARHTQQQRTNNLAPIFFRQAKRLVQASLLVTPQPLEFFQAALLLSLWSTTIGQVPLSIDSWLLTSYALQQEIASSVAMSLKGVPIDSHRLNACCTWNHICLAHLQYCVGTGRKPMLQESQIERCADVLKFEVSQFEVRMVAELKLYWIMVNRCCASSVNLANIRTVLSSWKKEWSFLFDQPRSQFLEMGHHFAVLLACCRLVRSQPSKLSRSRLNEMVQLARNIIALAMSHTDERTPHLTDHIYHIITFSAITLCQLTTKYPNALVEPNTADPLEGVILSLIDWLRSIGLASHISRVLANIIATHYLNCTVQESSSSPRSANTNTAGDRGAPLAASAKLSRIVGSQMHLENPIIDYSFQDPAWTAFFDFSIENVAWPESSDLISNNYAPTDDSWTTPTYAASL